MRKTAAAILVAGVLFVPLGACAGAPTSTAGPSPGSLLPTTKTGSLGSAFFVSDTVGWELTVPPDRLRTVVLRTSDAGVHWQIWGIAPKAASPVGFSTSEVVLSYGSNVIRSSDGARWSVEVTPVDGSMFFLPDLQHGWLYGYLPVQPVPPSSTAAGKGGAPVSKGDVLTGIWSTTDGGSTWRLKAHGRLGDTGGTMSFWNPTTGMINEGSTLLLTHDGGATWVQVSLVVPVATANQFLSSYAPTMFDSTHGVMPFGVAGLGLLYVSRTDNGGLTWSRPQAVQNCLPCDGQVVFLDDHRWMAFSQADYLSNDGGRSWKAIATTNPGNATSGIEPIRDHPGTVFVFAPGMFASQTTDWGGHWRAISLPDTYPSYTGFQGQGGFAPAPASGSPAPLHI